MSRSKIALLCEGYNQFSPLAEKNWKIGNNTGNILFYTALNDILDCKQVSTFDKNRLNDFDHLVTTEFIWLREGTKPTENANYWLKNLTSRLVPISVGLQAHEFKKDFVISPEMQAMLSAIQERSSLFVRGHYTAEILAKHEIKNVIVVGCPSVYQLPLYHESLDFLFMERDVKAATANYSTFTNPLRPADDSLLQYISANATGFAAQESPHLKLTR